MLTQSEERIKRTFDLLAAGLGVIILLPVLAATALVVCVDSRGAIFYRGVRTGRGGQPFRIFKFRTMVSDADRIGGGSTAQNDPRVTRAGRFLRKYKLDELPQLLNVLHGEMSIVGPRPELPKYTELYNGDEQLILSVRPGITDYASIEFFQLSEVLGQQDPDRVYEEKVRPVKNALRVRYAREQSLAGDCRILLRTLLRLLWLQPALRNGN